MTFESSSKLIVDPKHLNSGFLKIMLNQQGDFRSRSFMRKNHYMGIFEAQPVLEYPSSHPIQLASFAFMWGFLKSGREA